MTIGREMRTDEWLALVTVESMNRLIGRAMRLMDASDHAGAVHVLTVACEAAQSRMATAVKEQKVSDEIGQEARMRVEVALAGIDEPVRRQP